MESSNDSAHDEKVITVNKVIIKEKYKKDDTHIGIRKYQKGKSYFCYLH